MRRLRYPNALRDEVCRLVAGHAFWLDGPIDGLFARRFLASHGIDRARRARRSTSEPTSRAKRVEPWELEHLAQLERLLEEERESPHRLSHLAVDGNDLLAIGYREGPALGAALARLLDVVVDDPAANDRDTPARRGAPMAALNAAAVRERYLRVREEAGPAVTVVAATKYVPLEELGVLAEAGVEVVGENRAQDLAAKHAVYGDAFRWHFIGHLQSNKVKVVNAICELVHSLDSDSAARRLTVPALLEVNLSGEDTKSGVAPDEIADWLERFPSIRGLMTMPPLADDPEASRPWFRRLAELAAEHGLARALDGHLAGLARRGRGGRDADPRRLHPVPLRHSVMPSSRGATIPPDMGLGDVWNRTLVYFGIAEDEEWDDEELTTTGEELERDYRRRERANVRRLPRRREAEAWSEPDSVSEPESDAPRRRDRRPRGAPGSAASTARGRRCACTSSCRAASTTPSRSPTGSRTPSR